MELNLQKFWVERLHERGEAPLFKVPAQEGERHLSYKHSTFFRRALRISNALLGELRMSPGDVVAVLSDSTEDLALTLHGIWLAKLVAFPLFPPLNDSSLAQTLVDNKVRALIFPPPHSAQIAGLFSKKLPVEHWLLSSGSPGARAVAGVKRFDDLIAAGSFGAFNENAFEDGDCDALILKLSGHRENIRYTQTDLVRAGLSDLGVFDGSPGQDRLCYSWLSIDTFDGLFQLVLEPLFSGWPVLLNRQMDSKKFWDELTAAGVNLAYVRQDMLRLLTKRGKTKRWALPPEFKLRLSAHEPLSSLLLTKFEKRLGVPVLPYYRCEHDGRVLSAFPVSSEPSLLHEQLCSGELASVGLAAAGAGFEIFTGHAAAKPTEEGQICPPGDVRKFSHGLDFGYFKTDSRGGRHLVVIASSDGVVIRNKVRVSLKRIENVIYGLDGVDFALVLAFRNNYVGFEIGAYIIPSTTTPIFESDVFEHMKNFMGFEESPKVLVFGEPLRGKLPPTPSEVAKYFERYLADDFSRNRLRW